MAQLLDAPESRLLAILTTGRGTSGMGSEAAARAIAADYFRRFPSNAPAGEDRVGAESIDRGLELEWADLGDVPLADNEMNGVQSRVCRVNVRVTYVHGPEADNFAVTQGSESASTVALNARKRALSDAEKIRRALCFPVLFQDTGAESSDPVIYNVTRVGRSTVAPLGAGRLECVSPFDVEIQYTTLTAYSP